MNEQVNIQKGTEGRKTCRPFLLVFIVLFSLYLNFTSLFFRAII